MMCNNKITQSKSHKTKPVIKADGSKLIRAAADHKTKPLYVALAPSSVFSIAYASSSFYLIGLGCVAVLFMLISSFPEFLCIFLYALVFPKLQLRHFSRLD
uniref:Uncharacterized protein n=1 Tax=Kalanchoe fedtschenkoi TaxID=63787 RepID=A0A7N0TAZ2_KALFE